MAFSRRSVLRFGLLGAGAIAVGGIGISLRPGKLRTPTKPLKVLDELEFSLVAAVADRVIPPADKFLTAEQAEVAYRVDAVLGRAEPWLQSDYKKLIRLFENGVANLVFGLRPTPFTRMSPESQDAVLAEWADSSLKLRRTIYKALRGIIIAAYYGNPATYVSVGYAGPPDIVPFGEPRALVAAKELDAK